MLYWEKKEGGGGMYYLQERRMGDMDRRAFSRIGWALAAMLFGELAAQVVLLTPVMLAAPALLEEGWFLGLLGGVSVYGVGFPLALLVLRSLPKPEGEPGRDLDAPAFARMAVQCLGGVYLANLVTVTLMGLVGLLRGEPVYNPVDSMGEQPVWVNLLIGCVLAPVLEELVFRGAVFRRLRPYGDRFAMLASALLFALMHGNVYQMGYAFVTGVFFASVVARTGRLRWTMLLHALVNFASAGLLPLMDLLGDAGETAFSLLIVAAMGLGGREIFRWSREVGGWLQTGRADREKRTAWKQFLLNPGMVVFLLGVVLMSAMNFAG